MSEHTIQAEDLDVVVELLGDESKEDLLRLTKSKGWSILNRVMAVRLGLLLIQLRKASTMEEVCRLQAQLDAIENLLDAPLSIYEDMKYDEEQQTLEGENNET